MSTISADTVKHIAALSRIKLTKNEVAQYQKELAAIIDFVEQLDVIDTKDIEPTAQVTGLEGVTREDKLVDYQATPTELLKNAPETDDHYLKVRKVL